MSLTNALAYHFYIEKTFSEMKWSTLQTCASLFGAEFIYRVGTNEY